MNEEYIHKILPYITVCFTVLCISINCFFNSFQRNKLKQRRLQLIAEGKIKEGIEEIEQDDTDEEE